jgi:type VI secretion system ImpM family protein
MSVNAHCYGKLPIAGDYLRYRLDSPDSSALADWMEQGQKMVEAARRSGKVRSAEPHERPRRYRFAIDHRTGASLLAGILHESHDRNEGAGTRLFPFAYFVSLEAAPLRKRPGRVSALLGPVWEQLESRIQGFADAKNAEELFEHVAAPGLEPPDESSADQIESRLATTTAGAFWSSCLPGRPPESRIQLFELLMQALEPISTSGAGSASVSLKLPLGGSKEDVALQMCFWIRLVQRMIGSKRDLPHIFTEAPAPEAPARTMTLLYQNLDKHAYAALMTEEYESDYVDDLSELPETVSGRRGVGAERGQVLRKDDLRLLDLLERGWT